VSNTIADYNLWLVLLSYLVSVVGALTGLFVSQYVHANDGRLPLRWLALAAMLIGGCAVWAMHFLGMLAYDPGVPLAYDTVVTLISFIIPILFAFFGLYCVFRWPHSLGALVGAGVITGLGVASMHYTGMAAIRIAAHLTYDPWIVAGSILVAIAAASAALYIVVHARGSMRYLSSLVMGVAVCGMHYTGMAALSLEPADIDVEYFEGAITGHDMALAVTLAVIAACVIGATLGFSRLLEEPSEGSGTI